MYFALKTLKCILNKRCKNFAYAKTLYKRKERTRTLKLNFPLYVKLNFQFFKSANCIDRYALMA